jgi:hypothetical protein
VLDFLTAWYFIATGMELQMSTAKKTPAFHVCFSGMFSYLLYNHSKLTSLQPISVWSYSIPKSVRKRWSFRLEYCLSVVSPNLVRTKAFKIKS